ncbi:Putative hemeoglobin [Labilithrix luteola]|uniref:Putative hemeoglobin n=1 Tax=Labilithrix luteola TaxID=1391654 RepID=A0A0K1QEX6_9BACT|nr:globin domain-containing protein [Labilithrix luteola]AKV04273.1 Putative hemeoglobin [Labilithrix luteola]
MSLNAAVLRESLELVAQREPLITKRFYEILFDRYPQVQPLFSRNAPERQQKMLQDAIVAVVEHVEDSEWLKQNLTAIGSKHVDYGVTPEMYGWVGASLLATLAEIAGPAWTAEVEKAWTDAYGAISGLMIEGAKAS